MNSQVITKIGSIDPKCIGVQREGGQHREDNVVNFWLPEHYSCSRFLDTAAHVHL